MKKLIILCLMAFMMVGSSYANKKNSPKSIAALATRVLGKEKAKNFVFELTSNSEKTDQFEISSRKGKVVISGNSPIALASGFNWYLRYQVNTHISWEASQMNLPQQLPLPQEPLKKESPFQYSYYLNYCTFNYSMAFWDWERWEKELDWMAMNGINLPLAIVGTEAIWKNTLERLDFSKEDIDAFIPGPAFNAWWLMGNLEGWGGPLSDEYIEQQVVLQRKILTRMKELGMQPVLPGFFGMVPTTLKKKYPNADIRDQGLWAGGFQRPAFLSPTDDLFMEISGIYYEELKKLYGEVEYFSGDPFHEGGHTQGINLPEAGKNIVYGMRSKFPKSTWVFQGWGGNPRADLIQDINPEDLIILDLDCDNRPQWENRKGWSGKPWIWSMITNFGGNVGLFGRMDVMATEPIRALQHKEYSKNLVGIGAMMEGIDNNSVMYELLFELKWHQQNVNLDEWLADYTLRRYGQTNNNMNEAWQVLRKTVFGKKLDLKKSQQGTSESFLCARPAMKIERVSSWGSAVLYYNPAELLKAWTLFVNESDKLKSSEGFRYDLVDVTRQVLANYAQFLHGEIVTAYKQKDKAALLRLSNEFLELIADQDQLLSSIESLTLSNWISDARDRGTNDQEKDLFEFNARTQVTTWSFKNSNLHEYAHREWAGLLNDFYKPRWKMFFDYLQDKLAGKDVKEPDYYVFEKAWTGKKSNEEQKNAPDPVVQSNRMYKKYFNKISGSY
ncbi:alpha-N-acetylglucosaminidase [Puteibacter caeruleilacunae]|nr:alpha-N-acetylglucosaminidase [Puteibacter caeruleilacunae]